MQVTKISSNNNQNNNSTPNFKSLHVLHMPEQYANIPPERLSGIIKFCDSDYDLLLKTVRNFLSFVSKNFSGGDCSDWDVTLLKDGKPAVVRITQIAESHDIYFSRNKLENLAQRAEATDSFHYIANENNEIVPMKRG